MSGQPFWRRFLVKGVFWRRFLRWAVINIPFFLEPAVLAFWSLFFLLWGPGRRGVMKNLSAILPGSTRPANFLRTFRVFWNYACTITDNVHFLEERRAPDWEFSGWKHFEALEKEAGGAILLTAHMGSYDLGANLFADLSERTLHMVRAPETDPETREYEEALHRRTSAEHLAVDFNTSTSDLALELLGSLQQGHIVAIQGDRVTPGIASMETTLFGRATALPAGPFALAMAARVPLYPMFIVRTGRRRYRLVTCEPIHVVRRGRNRDEELRTAMTRWTQELESVIGRYWFQWFAFDSFSEELG